MYKNCFKRFCDFVISLFGIILLLPFFIIFIPLNAVLMHGNPFFVQVRPGKRMKNGKCKVFKLIKFRSMSNLRDKNGNLLPDSERLTKYGKWLRSTSLDELPELFNILKGDMAIVGPRPQLVKDMLFFNERVMHRQDVRPGLTGLAQVNGRNNISWEKKFDLDLLYIDQGITFFKDVNILIKTVINVLNKSDVVREGTSSDIDYGDWLVKEGTITLDLYHETMREQVLINE